MADKKITIKEYDGNFYDYTITIMNSTLVLLTKKELLNLYYDITDLITDDEDLWTK